MASETRQNQILLSARFSVRYGGKPPVLRDVQMEIRRGEVLGLVGQSGSGKSTLAMAVLGLLDKRRSRAEGNIRFQDSDLLQLSERELRALRGRAIALVLQSPLSSLNPALKIRTQLKEAWRAHASGTSVDCANAIRTSLQSVSLPADDEFLRKYPSQMSVGQAQRVLIAMAVMHRPALLIADEATSALDSHNEAAIQDALDVVMRGRTSMVIAHRLSTIINADVIFVVENGRIVESGSHAVLLARNASYAHLYRTQFREAAS